MSVQRALAVRSRGSGAKKQEMANKKNNQLDE